MTFSGFKSFVAAALQRNTTDFVQGTTDLLALAVNMARKNIERKRDFELAKETADLTVTVGEAAELADATYSGTADAISIKTVLRVQLSTDGVTFFPIRYSSRDSHMRRVFRNYEDLETLDDITGVQPTKTGRYEAVRYGDSIYLTPSDADSYNDLSTVYLRMDVVRWLDDYSVDDDTDFLLEHCVDYLMLETFRYMQLFLKEDVRLNVSDDAFARAWQSVVAWDSNLVAGDVDDANLD